MRARRAAHRIELEIAAEVSKLAPPDRYGLLCAVHEICCRDIAAMEAARGLGKASEGAD